MSVANPSVDAAQRVARKKRSGSQQRSNSPGIRCASSGLRHYIELLWDKVIEIEDLDRIEGGRKGIVYNKKRPLIIDQGASE